MATPPSRSLASRACRNRSFAALPLQHSEEIHSYKCDRYQNETEGDGLFHASGSFWDDTFYVGNFPTSSAQLSCRGRDREETWVPPDRPARYALLNTTTLFAGITIGADAVKPCSALPCATIPPLLPATGGLTQ